MIESVQRTFDCLICVVNEQIDNKLNADETAPIEKKARYGVKRGESLNYSFEKTTVRAHS